MKSAENAQLSNNYPFVNELVFSKVLIYLKYYMYCITTIFNLTMSNPLIIEPKLGELLLTKKQ